jgi:hypothetical protein
VWTLACPTPGVGEDSEGRNGELGAVFCSGENSFTNGRVSKGIPVSSSLPLLETEFLRVLLFLRVLGFDS